MGLKFNVDKYAIANANTRIKPTAVDRRAPQYTAVRARNKIKKLTLDNRKFLRLISSK
jgi:hypothetical protein